MLQVDANGILNVGAEDKGTGKKERITITAEKGRLSQEEIERMVKEAEEFAEQDKAVKAKIDARNQLETYVYNMKSTVEDKLKDKIDAEDRDKIKTAIKEAQEWLEENSDAGRQTFAFQEHLLSICCPCCAHASTQASCRQAAYVHNSIAHTSKSVLWRAVLTRARVCVCVCVQTLTSTPTSSRRLRRCATPSSQRSTRREGVMQAALAGQTMTWATTTSSKQHTRQPRAHSSSHTALAIKQPGIPTCGP